MKPEEIGRRFGIGVRVAGRIAKDRAQSGAESQPQAGAAQGHSAQPHSAQPYAGPAATSRANSPAAAAAWSSQSTAQSTPRPAAARSANAQVAGQAARAAGRGVAGFLKPFGRVGGILWLEVTGFFFGLFALVFAITLWRTHTDYAQGPHHQQFLTAAVLTVVFLYLSISSFLRAQKR